MVSPCLVSRSWGYLLWIIGTCLCSLLPPFPIPLTKIWCNRVEDLVCLMLPFFFHCTISVLGALSSLCRTFTQLCIVRHVFYLSLMYTSWRAVWHYRPFDQCWSRSVRANWHSGGVHLRFLKNKTLWTHHFKIFTVYSRNSCSDSRPHGFNDCPRNLVQNMWLDSSIGHKFGIT
jgi:hypothetical protein